MTRMEVTLLHESDVQHNELLDTGHKLTNVTRALLDTSSSHLRIHE